MSGFESPKIKIVAPYVCMKCGERWGPTNATYKDIPIYYACKCSKLGQSLMFINSEGVRCEATLDNLEMLKKEEA